MIGSVNARREEAGADLGAAGAVDDRRVPPPTFSNSQRYGSRFHGSPVVQIAFSDDMSARGSPFGISARTSVGRDAEHRHALRLDQLPDPVGAESRARPPRYTIVAPDAPPPTTVHGPMIHPMSVAKWMRSPGLTFVWYATSRAIETRKPPWTWSAPFGFPVVPDVYASRYGCSESTCLGGRSPDVFSTSSSQKRSRPTSSARRRGPAAARRPCARPSARIAAPRRRSASSARPARAAATRRRVISAFAFASCEPRGDRRRREAGEDRHLNRAEMRACVRRDRDLRRHGQEDPDRVARADADRDERLRRAGTPRRDSSRHVSAPRVPSSPCQTAASSGKLAGAQRWTQFQARLSFPPVNQVAHSGPRECRPPAPRARENSSPRSSITAGQNRSGLVDRDAVELVVAVDAEPSRRAASRSRSRRPRLGLQMNSATREAYG